MYFLTQFKFKTDGTVEKGTSNFTTLNECLIQFHVAISSAMQKADTQKFVAIVLDENATIIKREVYEIPKADASEEM